MEAADLQTLTRDDLKLEWRRVFGKQPAPKTGKPTLIKMLTCEAQWKASRHSRPTLIRKLKSRLSNSSKPPANEGARLLRVWNGKEHVVDVTDEGYLWNGTHWRSLSAIAKEITGTKWSGPRFFGVQS